MLSLINPRQTVIVSCRAHMAEFGKDNIKDNLIAVDWHTPLSFKPMIYGVSIAPARYSHGLMQKGGVFAVNFMPYELEKEVLACGRNSGRHSDKFTMTGLTRGECEKIDCCFIQESSGHLECELIEEKQIGDHTFFIANVLASVKRDNKPRLFHLAGDDFTTTRR